MPTHHQHIMAGETIALQCKSITQYVRRVYAPDLAVYLKYPETGPGTYIIFFSVMDTATSEDGVWRIRALKNAKIEASEEMFASLAYGITPFMVLPPSAEAIGFTGPGGRQWDSNIYTFCRRLNHHRIAFMQPHSLEKLALDNDKLAPATAHNTNFTACFPPQSPSKLLYHPPSAIPPLGMAAPQLRQSMERSLVTTQPGGSQLRPDAKQRVQRPGMARPKRRSLSLWKTY